MNRPRRIKPEQRAPHTRAAPFRCRLVVMAKAPVAGRVKTRLARELGVATATRFARQAMAALLARMSRGLARPTAIAIAVDGGMGVLFWPRGVALMPQDRGDLGARMQRIMARMPPGPVVIIGTDVPGISATQIRAAFRLLGAHDAVLGAASDGGYWLVGMRRRPRLLAPFKGVRWSTTHALADTLANLNGRSIARVATLADVDDARDFSASAAHFGRRVTPRT
jgi:hypothetical protein